MAKFHVPISPILSCRTQITSLCFVSYAHSEISDSTLHYTYKPKDLVAIFTHVCDIHHRIDAHVVINSNTSKYVISLIPTLTRISAALTATIFSLYFRYVLYICGYIHIRVLLGMIYTYSCEWIHLCI